MFANKEYIYAVYTEKSFSKAAEKLYISQPCLSAMVKKVEKKLGVPLFYRSTRTIQLTEYGRHYIDAIEEIMKVEESMDAYLHDVRGLKTGEISIGANSVVSSYIFPKIIQTFSQKYPEITLNLHEGNRIYLEEQMEKGNIDIIIDNYPVDPNLFEIVPLFQEHLFLAIPVKFPAMPSTYLTAEEIIAGQNSVHDETPDFLDSSMPWITVKKGNDSRKRFDQFCSAYHINPDKILEVDQMTTAWNLAVNGWGLTVTSDTLIKNMANADQFVYYPIISSIGERYLFLHYPRYKYINLPVQQLIKDVTDLLA